MKMIISVRGLTYLSNLTGFYTEVGEIFRRDESQENQVLSSQRPAESKMPAKKSAAKDSGLLLT